MCVFGKDRKILSDDANGVGVFGDSWCKRLERLEDGVVMSAPETLEEARKYRYGRWSKKPDYREGECIQEVWTWDGWGSCQCSRKNGHGPDKAYCKQHAKMVKGKE